MSAPQHSRVIIIGSGPAGYTAAVYAARAMLEPVLIAGFDQGGQLMITTEVENYPGFAEPIQGPWLMEQMRLQAEHVGTRLVSDHIVEARLEKRPFTLIGDSGTTYTCDALIVATGAKAKWLGIPSEERFKGFGVSACATCDGFFFRGRKVIVVGGGNTAVEEALYLSNLASHVTLVHRRDALRSERVLQERLRKQKNVSVLFDHVVDEVLGTEGPLAVTGARVKSVITGETQTHRRRGRLHRHRPCAGVRTVQGSAYRKAHRLYRCRARLDPHEYSRRLCGGRRRRRSLPAGGHRRRSRLHGGARSREVPDGRACRRHRTCLRRKMSDRVIFQKKAMPVEVEAGKTYYWCACGLSAKQPFCDGSHKDTGISPVAYKAEATGKAFFCGCKHSKNEPLCDGSHKEL